MAECLAGIQGSGFAFWASPGRGRRERQKIEEEGKGWKKGREGKGMERRKKEEGTNGEVYPGIFMRKQDDPS